jgi:hypothetical protein
MYRTRSRNPRTVGSIISTYESQSEGLAVSPSFLNVPASTVARYSRSGSKTFHEALVRRIYKDFEDIDEA